MDNLVAILREVFDKVPAIKTDRELLKNMVLGYTISNPTEKTNFDELLATGFIDALFNVPDVAVLKTGADAIATIVSTKLGCGKNEIIHSINLWYQVIKNTDDELVAEEIDVTETDKAEPEKTSEPVVVETIKEPEQSQQEKDVPVEDPQSAKPIEEKEMRQESSRQEEKEAEAKAVTEEKEQPETKTPAAAEQGKKVGPSGDVKLGLICFLVFIVFLLIKLNTGSSMDRAFFGTTIGDKPKKTKVVKTASAKENTARVDLSFLDENTKPEPAPEPKTEPQAQPEQPKEPEQAKAPVAQQAPESKPQTAAQPVQQKKQTKQRTKSNTKVKKVPAQMPATQQQAAPAPAPVQTGPDEAELARLRREENLRRINSAQ